MSVTQFSAAIIGLGKIGQGLDYERVDDEVIATHASAYRYHPGFNLVAAVDTDPIERKRFEDKYGLPAYPDLDSLMRKNSPCIFSIATPPEQHLPVFQNIMQYEPLGILCEKPVASCVEDARRMCAIAGDRGCTVAVNYIRRFEPGSTQVRRIVHEKEIGKVFKGIGWYSKGFLNNGSHFVDLLRFWLGEVTAVEIVREGRLWDNTDPEPDVCLHFGETPVYVLAGRAESFSVGKIELFCDGGIISYADLGHVIEIRKTCPGPFAGYRILSEDRESVKTDMKHYQFHVLEGLYQHLTNDRELNSDVKSATETLEVIENVCSELGKR